MINALLYDHGKGYPAVDDLVEADDLEIYAVTKLRGLTCRCGERDDNDLCHMHAELRWVDPDDVTGPLGLFQCGTNLVDFE